MAREVQQAIEEARRTGRLFIRDQQLGELPPEIGELTDLRDLVVDSSGLTALPDWLTKLTSLETLDLSNNAFREFPPVISRLPSLRYLGLSSTLLEEIPPGIDALTNLTVLELSGNQLRRLPASIGALRQLRVLDLGMNPVASLPETVGSLQELTHLYLWRAELKEVPPALRTLGNLEVLDLSTGGRASLNTRHVEGAEGPPVIIWSRMTGSTGFPEARLTSLPEWLPHAFPKLRRLYLGGHRIRLLPAELPAMGQLQGLYLSGNQLGAIPEAILELAELRHLDLRGNGITELPAGLERLQKLEYLDLADNPLPIPPEVLARPDDPMAILDFAAPLGQETRPLDEAKLLVVGEGSVGKTSLVKRLVYNRYTGNEGKTEGIDVTRWQILADGHTIGLNIWDFGGQEIMHATHQFFLTKRSVYVLVIDGRQGEEQNRIEYWLKLIQSYSDRSPVIIVGNKSDEAMLDIDRRGLRAKYDNIVDIISVSCLTGQGIDEMKAMLARTVAQLRHVRDLLPTAFFEIKEHLEELEVNYLPFAEYEQLCRSKGIVSKGSQKLLIGFLHDLGTVLCFRDDPRLADTSILNPSWVTGGVYRLLNSNLAAQRKGLLRWQDINEILESDEYPTERRSFIVDMMKKFELCYESDEIFLIPDLLTKEEPDTGVWDDVLHFEVKYDVLPSSIISRLIVRMNRLISKGTVWRTGMVLAHDRNRALVKADREDSVITIDVSGPKNSRRGLLTAIRTELRGIERTIPGLTGEERVPVPGHPGVWIPYSHLLDLEAAGRETVVPQGLVEDFNIRDLLAGIETPTDRLDGKLPPTDVAGPPVAALEATGDAQPWTARESMRLGWFLIAATIVILAACVGAYRLLGAAAAAAIGVALAIVVTIGYFILRTSGRISEKGFLEGMKQNLGSERVKGTEPSK